LDISAVGDFLGFCDQKFYINLCPVLDDYGVNDRLKLRIEGKDY